MRAPTPSDRMMPCRTGFRNESWARERWSRAVVNRAWHPHHKSEENADQGSAKAFPAKASPRSGAVVVGTDVIEARRGGTPRWRCDETGGGTTRWRRGPASGALTVRGVTPKRRDRASQLGLCSACPANIFARRDCAVSGGALYRIPSLHRGLGRYLFTCTCSPS